MAHIQAGTRGSIIEGQKVVMDSYESFHFVGDLLATTLMAYAAPKKEQDPATGVILDFFRNADFDATPAFKAARAKEITSRLGSYPGYLKQGIFGTQEAQYPSFLKEPPSVVAEKDFLVEYAAMKMTSTWMSALYFQAAHRLYDITNNAEVLTPVSNYADFLDANGIVDGAVVHSSMGRLARYWAS